MLINKLFSSSITTEKALDAAWKRNEVISHNLANVDTPNYKRKTIKFEEYLKREGSIQLNATRPGHFKGRNSSHISIAEDNNALSNRLDGNNVDIENEMALMAKNSIKYNTLIQNMNNGIRRLKNVINEGK